MSPSKAKEIFSKTIVPDRNEEKNDVEENGEKTSEIGVENTEYDSEHSAVIERKKMKHFTSSESEVIFFCIVSNGQVYCFKIFPF